jgi:hypothetical protein
MCRWVVTSHPGHITSGGRTSVSFVQEAGQTPDPLWKCVEKKKKLLPLLGVEPRTAQPVASSYTDYEVPAR